MNLNFSAICLMALFSVTCVNAMPPESEIIERISKMNLTDSNELATYIAEILHPYKDHLRTVIRESMSFSQPTPRADFITCEVCRPAVPVLRFLLALGIPEDFIIFVIATACRILDLAPAPELCAPTILSYAEPTIYIIKNKPDLNRNDFCGILNPGCSNVSESLTNWVIPTDPNKPAVGNDPEPQITPRTKILQITDVHLDLNYTEGTSAVCNYPACCREENGKEGNNLAGPFGHFDCALPMKGLQALYDHAKRQEEVSERVKYIFLTGDYVHSNVWQYSEEENRPHISAVTSALRTTFPDVPIYPVTGNHEPNVVNMYPPSSIWGTSGFDLLWMYEAASEHFATHIPADQLALFRRGGYYTVTPEPGFRLVILNTNLCYINNFWLAFDPVDPEGQLAWFSEVLLQAEQEKETVYIVGHIQPGSGSCWPIWSEQFDRIINRFAGIIKAQFYGHSHTEYFTLAFDKETKKPISTSYIAPSTVTDRMHAGYKAYYADGERGLDSTWEIVDHETWILNIIKSNELNQAVIERVYNAREDYGLTSFRPEALYDFVMRMVKDDALFEKYQKNHYKGETSPRYSPCKDDVCRLGYLCELFQSNSNDDSHCNEIIEAFKNKQNSGQIIFFSSEILFFGLLAILCSYFNY